MRRGFSVDDAPEEVRLVSSAVTTLTGNVVIALPKRLAGYGLRPYFSGGAGLTYVDVLGKFQIVEIHRTLPTLSLGGGVTGFLTDRVGLNWDIRRFSTFRAKAKRSEQRGKRTAFVLAGDNGGPPEVLSDSPLKIFKLQSSIGLMMFLPGDHRARGVVLCRGRLPSCRFVRAQQSPCRSTSRTVHRRSTPGDQRRRPPTLHTTRIEMIVPAWVDRTIATRPSLPPDRYDTLTRGAHLSRSVDGAWWTRW